jgi:hypothetical protein
MERMILRNAWHARYFLGTMFVATWFVQSFLGKKHLIVDEVFG